ncbi:ankyrin repeat domain-containing protein [Phenylobacterium sp.]|uniref:ankyrin repeat domain-containing protein n=1 Tax=Phenylobacterium sp. TaxID=1871053 RepID=UPI003BAD2291
MRHLACLGLLLGLFAGPAAAQETTPICQAAAGGTGAEVKALLAGGASLTASCEYGYHPIHTAVSKNNLGALEALLAAGADANDPHGYQGQAPIVSVQSAAAARLLIARGAKVGARDKNGASTLSHVASNTPGLISEAEGAAIAQLLLDHGFPVDAQDRFGNTALADSGRFCQLPMVRVLLDHGASPNLRSAGETVLGRLHPEYYADDPSKQAACRQVQALLIAHGAVK